MRAHGRAGQAQIKSAGGAPMPEASGRKIGAGLGNSGFGEKSNPAPGRADKNSFPPPQKPQSFLSAFRPGLKIRI